MRLAMLSVLTLTYPLLVFLGMQHAEPRQLALLLMVLAVARALGQRNRIWLLVSALATGLAAMAWFGNQLLPLQLYPVLVNATLLVLFLLSLRFPPSAIERLARLREPDLPESGVRYTRRVTQVWCVFFVFNGSMALITALWCSPEIWALYNGLIAYLLMAALFGAEWLVRQHVRAGAGHD